MCKRPRVNYNRTSSALPGDKRLLRQFGPRKAGLPMANSVKTRHVFADLPVPLTPLLGREQESAHLTALFRRPEVRLLTLTGPGGVGKTRLPLSAAHDLTSDFSDGVCFVPLAAISDPDFVLPAIAQALGLREAAHRSVLE